MGGIMSELEELRKEFEQLRRTFVDFGCKLTKLEEKQAKQKEDLAKLCTRDEKIILKNLWSNNENKEYTEWYIGRDYANELQIHDGNPTYSQITMGNIHGSMNDYDFDLYNHLFQFIEKGKSYKVADLIADLEEEEEETELWV